MSPIRPSPGQPSRWSGWIWYVGFAAFLGLAVLGSPAPEPVPAAETLTPKAVPEPAASETSYPMAAPAAATMEDAVRLIEAARERFALVGDYSCRLVQRERVGETLPPETAMAMRVRARPFAVHLKWLEPRSMQGQEAAYAAGRNGGKMRVRAAGLLGAVGFVTLDVNDPRARRSSRHSITEAGLGNLIERFAAGWPNEVRHGGTDVRIDDFLFDGRPCTRVETVHHANPDSFFLFSRSLVYFDKETQLPVRVENYDWPKRSGADAELLEEYSYLDLRLNVGLADEAFDR
jgi:hypothetical protein